MTDLNGTPVRVEDLQVLALSNYGHFTSMRLESGAVRGLDLHLERLSRDSHKLFDTNIDRDAVRKYVRSAVADEKDPAINARVTVFDPALAMGHPGADATPGFLVSFRPAEAAGPLSPWRIGATEYARDLPEVKHTGLMGTIATRRQAQRRGFDDVLFTDADGVVSEGATWNIGFYDGTDVIWPDAPCLDGTTMQLIRSAHPTITRRVELAALPQMVTAFATNASIGVRPVACVEDVEFDTEHPILDTLRDAYLAITPEMV